MKRTPLTALVLSMALQGSLGAAERGTPAEAKALLGKAVAHYKAVGRKQALADFMDKKGSFIDRDLYLFCIGPDHVTLANGGFPSYVGTSVDALKDADGKPLGKVLWETGVKGEGSVAYRWINPLSHRTEDKVSFVQRVGDDVCGVGAYASKR